MIKYGTSDMLNIPLADSGYNVFLIHFQSLLNRNLVLVLEEISLK